MVAGLKSEPCKSSDLVALQHPLRDAGHGRTDLVDRVRWRGWEGLRSMRVVQGKFRPDSLFHMTVSFSVAG
jgi:hypothetical protein